MYIRTYKLRNSTDGALQIISLPVEVSVPTVAVVLAALNTPSSSLSMRAGSMELTFQQRYQLWLDNNEGGRPYAT